MNLSIMDTLNKYADFIIEWIGVHSSPFFWVLVIVCGMGIFMLVFNSLNKG